MTPEPLPTSRKPVAPVERVGRLLLDGDVDHRGHDLRRNRLGDVGGLLRGRDRHLLRRHDRSGLAVRREPAHARAAGRAPTRDPRPRARRRRWHQAPRPSRRPHRTSASPARAPRMERRPRRCSRTPAAAGRSSAERTAARGRTAPVAAAVAGWHRLRRVRVRMRPWVRVLGAAGGDPAVAGRRRASAQGPAACTPARDRAAKSFSSVMRVVPPSCMRTCFALLLEQEYYPLQLHRPCPYKAHIDEEFKGFGSGCQVVYRAQPVLCCSDFLGGRG